MYQLLQVFVHGHVTGDLGLSLCFQDFVLLFKDLKQELIETTKYQGNYIHNKAIQIRKKSYTHSLCMRVHVNTHTNTQARMYAHMHISTPQMKI